MAKITKIITATKHDPIYQEGWSLTSLKYQYLKTKGMKEKTKTASGKNRDNNEKHEKVF